jgi:hypothetical protein
MSELISGSDISKVAKAIHDKGQELGWFRMAWESLPVSSQQKYEQLATAAIQVMKEQPK